MQIDLADAWNKFAEEHKDAPTTEGKKGKGKKKQAKGNTDE